MNSVAEAKENVGHPKWALTDPPVTICRDSSSRVPGGECGAQKVTLSLSYYLGGVVCLQGALYRVLAWRVLDKYETIKLSGGWEVTILRPSLQ
jgi:hypothetical protein